MRHAEQYPEHEKLRAIADQSQLIGEFVEEWCASRGMQLCKLVDSGMRTGFHGDEDRNVIMEYQPLTGVQQVLAEFFGIDLARIDAEKRAMLEALRSVSQSV
jgi:hypothetical protein